MPTLIRRSVREDTEKLIKEVILRDYLDKNAKNVRNICTYMVQVIDNVPALIL